LLSGWTLVAQLAACRAGFVRLRPEIVAADAIHSIAAATASESTTQEIFIAPLNASRLPIFNVGVRGGEARSVSSDSWQLRSIRWR
jgi:hypothetical protein